jgi:hypothetical protein
MSTRTRVIRGLAVATAGIFLAGIGLTQSAGAAVRPLSSGGGCGPDLLMEACISASGSYVEPDAYLQARPGCQSVKFYVYDLTQGGTFGYSLPCGVNAHEGPFQLRGTQGHVYQSELIEIAFNTEISVYSKKLTFSN